MKNLNLIKKHLYINIKQQQQNIIYIGTTSFLDLLAELKVYIKNIPSVDIKNIPSVDIKKLFENLIKYSSFYQVGKFTKNNFIKRPILVYMYIN